MKESNIESLRNASSAVTKLAQDCDTNAGLREEYENVGRELLKRDPAQAKVIQDALGEASSKWEKVSNLLKEQRGKSQSLITMWETSLAQKKAVVEQLDECQDLLDALDEFTPQTPAESAEQVDRCKRGLDSLKKARYPFESYYKKQTQLIQELQTVPGFDVAPLKAELQEVQQKFTHLKSRLQT